MGNVIVTEGARAFTDTWVTLTNLRVGQGRRLPVRVWRLGPDGLSLVARSPLARFGVELVDAFRVPRRHPK